MGLIPERTACGEWLMERRLDRRFHMSVPAYFMWKTPGAGEQTGTGTTRDISLRGAFVFTDRCPPRGTLVQLKVLLGPELGDPGLVMKAKARVVRVERVSSSQFSNGFAVFTKKYVLESRSD